MSLRKSLLSTSMLAGILGGVLLAANEAVAGDPNSRALATPGLAVDGFNAKWEGLAGNLSGWSLYGSRAALSFPLATQWGLQVDLSAGSLGHRRFAGIAPHLFWRDPSRGLLGVYASHTKWNVFGGVHVTQVSGEGEIYFGRFTLQGIAGVETGNRTDRFAANTLVVPPGVGFGGTPPGVVTTGIFNEFFDVKTRFFDQVNLKYYLTDNWSGYFGHRQLGGLNAYALGSELALPLGRGIMASAFVEARVAGEGRFNGVWGGLKFYFGQKDKTLIRRHREDDPPFWDTLHSLVNSYGSSNSITQGVFCTPPKTLTPDGSCESGS